ncbi:hypothetical protein [Pseudoxanthomonas sp. J35]|uniref:hypothetical protein n=1 Tax=Pseudoxanthomonas sp. J35 TaxID=935852 RepID=UPI0012EC0ADF|nr:hypothetical protein [Pseudoxanthomonas sp. J35]
MYKSPRPAPARRGRAVIAGAVLAFAFGSPGLLPATAPDAPLQIRMVVIEPVDVATLPAPVQRLQEAWPGYAKRWAFARKEAARDPLVAVRFLRNVHGAMRTRADWQAWEADMAEAGQALLDGLDRGAPAAPDGARPEAGD